MGIRATEPEPGHLTTLPSLQQSQRSPLTLQPSDSPAFSVDSEEGKCCLLDAQLLFDSYNAVFLSSSKLALPMPGYSPMAGETERELVCTDHRGEDGHQAELQCRVTGAVLGTSSPVMTQEDQEEREGFQSAKPGRRRWVGGVQQPRAGESCRDLSVLYSSRQLSVAQVTIQGCTITSGSWLVPNPCFPSPS